ncbi:phosphoribosylformylglycinamidine synthase subunit PurQ [Natranaerobius trueperi]|uniref:Phosphoribosylformylglycinamidine synthase subunit PurQ n=1 Tax=Natranaerobius trueperi TaxID=759412 RepID=A0A226C128_9FIRM|nr:phosphoribosylformylglycinamidine synthase subunit PurQ [Natranaerobius trueperi]OWZ84742.1 phosphoribosylformylglycinamidine synthase I [Natranaerobius trueperi]
MNFGIVVFPGSTCDRDAFHFIKDVLQESVTYLWYKDSLPKEIDCVILPGGFSYGDYLRPGAISAHVPIMEDVIKFANNGGYVIGICNGFQILVESGLLPGTLIQNKQLKFVSKSVYLRVETTDTPFTNQLNKKESICLPIAHGDGNYYISQDELKQLESNNQILFRYVDRNNEPTSNANPNGSIQNIAGISNLDKNVLGMMPHPERAGEKILGLEDGLKIFKSILKHWNEQGGDKFGSY